MSAHNVFAWDGLSTSKTNESSAESKCGNCVCERWMSLGKQESFLTARNKSANWQSGLSISCIRNYRTLTLHSTNPYSDLPSQNIIRRHPNFNYIPYWMYYFYCRSLAHSLVRVRLDASIQEVKGHRMFAHIMITGFSPGAWGRVSPVWVCKLDEPEASVKSRDYARKLWEWNQCEAIVQNELPLHQCEAIVQNELCLYPRVCMHAMCFWLVGWNFSVHNRFCACKGLCVHAMVFVYIAWSLSVHNGCCVCMSWDCFLCNFVHFGLP